MPDACEEQPFQCHLQCVTPKGKNPNPQKDSREGMPGRSPAATWTHQEPPSYARHIVPVLVELPYLCRFRSHHCCGCSRGHWRLLSWGTREVSHLLPKDFSAVLGHKLHQHLHLHTAKPCSQRRGLNTCQTVFPAPDPCFCAAGCRCGVALPGSHPTSVCWREGAARDLSTAQL